MASQAILLLSRAFGFSHVYPELNTQAFSILRTLPRSRGGDSLITANVYDHNVPTSPAYRLQRCTCNVALAAPPDSETAYAVIANPTRAKPPNPSAALKTELAPSRA